MAEQLPLPLPLASPPKMGRGDFIVAQSNAAALDLIDRWPRWPGPAAALFGPPGTGKTHLAAIWAARSGAPILTGKSLTPEAVYALSEGFCAAVDDAVLAASADVGGRALFYLLNRAAQEGGFVLLCGPVHPAHWQAALPDLKTRLASLTAVETGEPDDALLAAVLAKLFADRQLRPSPHLIGFMVARMERSIAAAQRLAAAMDADALASGRQLSIEAAERLIAADTLD